MVCDYWIIKSLPVNFSKVAVIEYNPIFGHELLRLPKTNIEKFLIELHIIIQIFMLWDVFKGIRLRLWN